MKIIFCDNGIEPFLNFRGYVAEHFHKSGYDVSVIVPVETCTKKAIDKVPEYLRVYKVIMNKNGSNPLADLQYYRQLRIILKNNKPDIVFTYTIKPNIYGTLAAHNLGIRVVAMVAGLGYAFSGNSIIHKLGRSLYRYGLRKADRVIVLNSSNYKTLLSKGFSTKERLILFEGGEGVSLTQYPFCNDTYESVRFLMVARVLYDKGYSEYVEAAKIIKQKYPDIKVDLLGPLADDSPMGVPPEIVNRDHLLGYITYLGETDDVKQFVGLNGVVVVVVSSYNEGFNRSLMEACSMGRICITSDIPGCRELVQDKYNGYIVPPKNSQMLANAMLQVIEDSNEHRRQMAINANKLANEVFNIETILNKYDEILSCVLNN